MKTSGNVGIFRWNDPSSGPKRMDALIDTGMNGAAERRHLPSEFPAGATPVATPVGRSRLIEVVTTSLDDAKAEDTMLIDLAGKTSIADAMIITTGRSNTHVNAISDRVLRALKDADAARAQVEGLANGDWVLIDAGDVIVHIFRPEVRLFYNLEKMWGADRPLAV